MDSTTNPGSPHYSRGNSSNKRSRENKARQACRQSDSDCATLMHVSKAQKDNPELSHHLWGDMQREVRCNPDCERCEIHDELRFFAKDERSVSLGIYLGCWERKARERLFLAGSLEWWRWWIKKAGHLPFGWRQVKHSKHGGDVYSLHSDKKLCEGPQLPSTHLHFTEFERCF